MKNRIFLISTLVTLGWALVTPLTATAAPLPTCQQTDSDSDGDGFGWENGASCRIAATTNSAHPFCSNPDSDPDGDSFGWENGKTCIVPSTSTTTTQPVTNTQPECASSSSDPDGDGFGWENGATCLVTAATGNNTSSTGRPECSSAAADPDGDGFGWENGKTCEVSSTTSQSQSGIKPTSSVYPYRSQSPYADVIKNCALVSQSDQSCTLKTLPLIGKNLANPSVTDIMDRVLVTHDWMGQRFEELLNRAPYTLIRMFRSTTAIVIGSEVRPSSYRTTTGRIAIDPGFLWLTVNEKATIEKSRDFRSNFGPSLRFGTALRFTVNGQRAISSYSLDDNSTRAIEDIIIPAVSLLYHELAHATDVAPIWTIEGMNQDDTFYNAMLSNSAEWLAPRLQNIYPNENATLASLGGVQYFNDAPTEAEKNLTAAEVGALFDTDGATSFYSYSTLWEDFANLVEFSMIKFHYGVSTNVSFYDFPNVQNPNCSDYIMGWGVRNRIANPYVAQRAEWAVNRSVLTGSTIDSFFSNDIGTETVARVGEDYCIYYKSDRQQQRAPLNEERVH